MLIDLHVHSRYSHAGVHFPSSLIQEAMDRGLDGVALAERETVFGASEVQKEARRLGFPVFIGVEVRTDTGVLLCFPPSAQAPFFQSRAWEERNGLPAAETVVSTFVKGGGAVLACHLADTAVRNRAGSHQETHLNCDGQAWGTEGRDWLCACCRRLLRLHGLSGVEVLDSTSAAREGDNPYMQAALKLDLPCSGGSGLLDDISVMGTVATALRRQVSTQEQLVDELRQGAMYPVLIKNRSAGADLA